MSVIDRKSILRLSLPHSFLKKTKKYFGNFVYSVFSRIRTEYLDLEY